MAMTQFSQMRIVEKGATAIPFPKWYAGETDDLANRGLRKQSVFTKSNQIKVTGLGSS